MDAIREQLKKPLVLGIVAFIIGVFIGLVVLGWWLTPVQYYDAAPSNLRTDLQEDYMRMAIDTYAQTGDFLTAKQHWDSLGKAAPDILTKIQANPKQEKPAAITAFASVVQATSLSGTPGTPVATALPATTQATQAVSGTPAATTAPAKSSGSILRTILPVMCGLTLLLLVALGAVFLIRSRNQAAGGPPTPAQQAQEAAHSAEYTDYQSTGEEPPMAQFMASYKLGDDLFDDSFSIDSPGGEFLGECGVGISETIGVGDPKKVTAFEVWLFDKNDIQTVTKVLMSEHAYNDPTIRQRLASKGEPVLIGPDKKVLLETATLSLEARVVDMNYGSGALPQNSFFERLTLELAVWPKQKPQ
jgi:hypothetical protein